MNPSGWAVATITELAEAMFDGPFGSTLKTSDYANCGVRVVRLENIGHLRFRNEFEAFVSHEKASELTRHVLRAGDVLFSSFVDRETRVCQIPDELDGKAVNKADCFCVRTNRSICMPKFLAYRLAAPVAYEFFFRSVRGVTRPRVGLRDLANFSIQLPSLAEQRRIIVKLDALTARLDLARAELDRVPVLARKLRERAVRSGFRGALTDDWRQERIPDNTRVADGLPNGWAWMSLAQLADIKSGVALGKKRSSDAVLIEAPYLRVANVQRGSLDLSVVKRVSVTKAEMEALRLQPGDILLNEGGDRDKLGRGWVWAGQIPDCIHQNHVFRARLRDTRNSAVYVSLYANEFGQDYFLEHGTQTTNLASISKSKISALPIPIAPPDEQNEIVKRVQAVFARADRLEAEAARARALLDRLESAILAKAFRGELVPQDPNDEPASVLLERIRAERAAQRPQSGRVARGRPKKRAAVT